MTTIAPQGSQLDLFGGEAAIAASAQRTPSKEGLRNGHFIAKCGPATFEYLVAYATQRGLLAGAATPAGKKQHGKRVSLLIKKKRIVRACFSDARPDAKPRIRRLSAARFIRLVDAFAAKRKEVEP